MLLKRADLLVTRGSCYGLVGQNGVGKTTLLTRIAAGDIDNFPTDLNCYYVQHEILDDSGARFLSLHVVLVMPHFYSCTLLAHAAGVGVLACWRRRRRRRWARRPALLC